MPQSPFFASDDVDVAYAAAKAKIDLDNPANSRLVRAPAQRVPQLLERRLRERTPAEMQAAISAFADQIPLTQVDPKLVTSKALKLYDGIVASGGSRYEANVIALYEFKTGTRQQPHSTPAVSNRR